MKTYLIFLLCCVSHLALGADPLKYRITSSNILKYSAYGNGLFVQADRDRPFLRVSSDASVWTPVDLSDFFDSEFNPARGLWFAGGRFFLQDRDGKVYQSTNGQNWFLLDDLGTIEINDMASDGVTLVWVTSGGIYRGAASLAGGVTLWDSFVASSIDFGGSTFLCAGSNQTRFFSGSASSPSTGAPATGIVKFFNTRFFVIGNQSTKVLFSDGTLDDSFFGGFGSFNHAYIHSGSLFATTGSLIFRMTVSGNGQRSWSLDGDLDSSTGSDPKSYLRGRGFSATQFEFSSPSGFFPTGNEVVCLLESGGVASSPNGVSGWTGHFPVSGRRMAGGDTPGFVVSAQANHLTTSVNGESWRSALAIPANEFLTDIAYGNDDFLAVSRSGVAYRLDATVPADLTGTWTRITNLPHFREITFGAGVFVAQTDRSDPNGGSGRMFHSVDGATWTEISLPNPSFAGVAQVIFTGGQFIATVNTNSNRYWTSSDGMTWTQELLPADIFNQSGDFYHGVLSFDGKLVFVRDNGIVVQLGNGTWQFIEISGPRNIEQVCGVLIVNASRGNWYSDDGLVWNLGNTVPWRRSSYGTLRGSAISMNGSTIVTNFEGSSLAETQATPNISGIRSTPPSGIRTKENEPLGTEVVILAPESIGDYGGIARFSLVSGMGDDDNALFSMENGILRIAQPLDFEESPSRSVRVRMTIPNLAVSLEEVITIEVLNLPLLSFDHPTVTEGGQVLVNLVLSETPYDGWTQGRFKRHTEEGSAFYGMDFNNSPLFEEFSLSSTREISFGTIVDDLDPEAPEFYEVIFYDIQDIEFSSDRLRVTIDDNDLGRGLDEVPVWVSQGGDFQSMVFGPTSGIAGDNDGRIFLTEDGLAWEEVLNVPGLNFSQMVHGNGVYLAIGSAGRQRPKALEDENPNLSPLEFQTDPFLYRSTDGRNWTLVDFIPPTTLREITYGNGLFVGLDFREIITSSDGVSWSSIPLADVSANPSETYTDLAFGNGLFVAAGSRGSFITSSDTQTWSVAFTGTNTVWRAITHGDAGFVAIANGRTATSNDGVTWTEHPQTTLPSFFPDLGFGDGRYILVTSGGSGNEDLFESTDGVIWSSTDLGTSNSQFLRGFAAGFGKNWIFGNRQLIFNQENSSIEWFTRRNLAEVATSALFSDGSITAIAGSRSVRIQGSDGVWQTSLDGLDAEPTDLWHENGTWVLTAGFERIYRSSDGANWTMFPIIPGDPADNLAFRSVTNFGGNWYISASSGKILKSTDDGVSWTVQTILSTVQPLIRIREVNGVLFAVGGSTIASSSDGNTWNEIILPGIVVNDVTFANGQYVASASGGRILTSTDLTTWNTLTPSGLSNRNVTRIAYGNGIFIVNLVGRLAFSTTPDGPWVVQGNVPSNELLFDGSEFITGGNSAESLYRSSDLSTGFIFSFGDTAAVSLLSNEQAAITADASQDGLVNGVAYAFGLSLTNPVSSEQRMRLPVAMEMLGQNTAALNFALPENAPMDVTYCVDFNQSLSLNGWSEIARKTGNDEWTGDATVIEESPQNGITSITVESTQMISQTNSGFMRLRIEIAE